MKKKKETKKTEWLLQEKPRFSVTLIEFNNKITVSVMVLLTDCRSKKYYISNRIIEDKRTCFTVSRLKSNTPQFKVRWTCQCTRVSETVGN
jgi:hypothetical protein